MTTRRPSLSFFALAAAMASPFFGGFNNTVPMPRHPAPPRTFGGGGPKNTRFSRQRKLRKNPFRGIACTETNASHIMPSHDPRRRHNEERRGHGIASLIASLIARHSLTPADILS